MIIEEKGLKPNTLPLNSIIYGDALTVLRKLPSNSVDLIITDPPYLINYKTNRRLDKDSYLSKPIANDQASFKRKMLFILKELHRVLKDNSAIYIYTSWKTIDVWKPMVEQFFNIKNIIVWVKNNWTVGDLEAQYAQQYELVIYANKGKCPLRGKRDTDVWFFNRVPNNKLLHPNQKPVEMIKYMIEKSSDVGDVILDPFFGSGSVGVACLETGRKFIGIEIDLRYCQIAKQRLKPYLTQQRLPLVED